jgi:hypothetical protein
LGGTHVYTRFHSLCSGEHFLFWEATVDDDLGVLLYLRETGGGLIPGAGSPWRLKARLRSLPPCLLSSVLLSAPLFWEEREVGRPGRLVVLVLCMHYSGHAELLHSSLYSAFSGGWWEEAVYR